MTNGILLALIAYASYSGSDAVVKSLGGQLTIFEIGFFITLFAGFFLFFTRPAGERWRDFWRTKRPWAVAGRPHRRGVLSVYAFTTMRLAEVYELVFLAPVCVTILSTMILKEKVGPWRWLAVVAGFAGVMLVVRPGFRELNLGRLAAFGVAFLAAASVILMRSLAQQEKRTTMLGVLVGYGLAFNGIGAAATSFTVPDAKQLMWLVMAGAFTACGQLLQLLAVKYAPANRIAPTHYSQIVWAVILGAMFFQEYPDWLSLVGLAVVGGSGLLTMVREEARLGTVRWNRLRTGWAGAAAGATADMHPAMTNPCRSFRCPPAGRRGPALGAGNNAVLVAPPVPARRRWCRWRCRCAPAPAGLCCSNRAGWPHAPPPAAWPNCLMKSPATVGYAMRMETGPRPDKILVVRRRAGANDPHDPNCPGFGGDLRRSE